MPSGQTVLTIVGNLTADPELSFTTSGAARAAFTIASNPRVWDRDTAEFRDGEPLFMRCTAWRDLAQHVAESLTQGMRVIATGALRQFEWTDANEITRTGYGLEIEEIGPSLRWATAQVTRATRTATPPPAAEDPWASSTPARPATSARTKSAKAKSAAAGPGQGDEPPF